ncbi:MAG: DUF979 family protein [Bryobacteraceae bacterium]
MIAALFRLETVYALTGVVICLFAMFTFLDRSNPRRFSSSCFWGILGAIFLFGEVLPHSITGLLVLILVALDGLGGVAKGGNPVLAVGSPHGARIFLPVLAIPLVTLAVALAFRALGLDGNRGALVGLGFGGVVGMAVAAWLTGGSARDLIREGARLNESMGAVNILPQLLTALGLIFTAANLGGWIATGIQSVIPAHNLFLLVAANCLGMTLLTMILGNSFAAFPVIASGVLAPLLLKPYGVNPAMAAIITLTAGSSGTLITPMAANFNIVPAALLNLRDTYGVLRFQLRFALLIWPLHVLIMWAWIRWSI